MEGIKDQWVRDGGGGELVGERGINEVDKEGGGKEVTTSLSVSEVGM